MKKTAIFIVIVFLAIQLINVDKTNPPVDESLTLNTPTEVMSILKKSCYDCHSNETKWPWYSNIAPFSFAVTSHVSDGREAVNFSEWKNIDKTTKIERLKRAIITVKNERMAPASYVLVHDTSKLDKDEKRVLVNWFEDELVKTIGEKTAEMYHVR